MSSSYDRQPVKMDIDSANAIEAITSHSLLKTRLFRFIFCLFKISDCIIC